jgi:tetratricopeptide (TPR) repeat protein
MGRNNLCVAYSAIGRYADGIREYRIALQSMPEYPEALSNLSFALYSVGYYEDAMRAARRAIEINPKYMRAYNNIGLIYQANAKIDSAIIFFDKALEINPKFIEAINNKGKSYRLQNRVDESIETHRMATQLDTTNIESWNNLGLAYMAKFELDTAITYFEKVLSIDSKNATAHNNISYSYYELLDYAMAMQHAMAAERLGMKVNPTYKDELEKALDDEHVRARMILVKTRAEAEAILKDLANGGNFAVLASRKSLDRNTANRGGDLGYFKPGDFQPVMEEAILKLKKQEISPIVETEAGFYIFERLK